MKVCSRCLLCLDDSFFNTKRRKKDGSVQKQSYCKNCQKIVWKEYYSNPKVRKEHQDNIRINNTKKLSELRSIVSDQKNKPCKDCGVKYNPWIMDFDHLNPNSKINNISTLVANKTKLEVILNEINKCDLVCANCHRERTHRRNNTPGSFNGRTAVSEAAY